MIVCHWPSRLMVFRPSVFAIKSTCCARAQGITASREIRRNRNFILRKLRKSGPDRKAAEAVRLFRHSNQGWPFPENDSASPMLFPPGKWRRKSRGNTYACGPPTGSEVQFEAKLNIARRARTRDRA